MCKSRGCPDFSCGWVGVMVEGKREGVGVEVDSEWNILRRIRCENDKCVEVIESRDDADEGWLMNCYPWYPYKCRPDHGMEHEDLDWGDGEGLEVPGNGVDEEGGEGVGIEA